MTLVFISGIAVIVVVLWDAFATLVLPRRVLREFRFAGKFFRVMWLGWSSVGLKVFSFKGRLRETYLGFFGPLGILVLIIMWAIGLTFGYSLLYWSGADMLKPPVAHSDYWTYLYFSGTTFFTLGLGDLTPASGLGKFLSVSEAGLGLGFLAIVIGYLPGLNQSFSRREVNISLLGTKAGSSPTAAAILMAHIEEGNFGQLRELLKDWERWSAEFMESHLSYPVLAYFRSQHEDQSWLGAITAILDTCAFVMACGGGCERQAMLTFTIARHALKDLALVFRAHPRKPAENRLPEGRLAYMMEVLAASGFNPADGPEANEKLMALRRSYEPLVYALSDRFLMPVPPWIPERFSDITKDTCWVPEEKEGKRL
ncbi:MAG: potassium channel family protein [Actinomycetota bacterium]|nr:potassium channel family protein [Actinomycetota bacterium]